MPVFVAKIANLIGWGEVSRSYRTRRARGRYRDTIQVRLDGHVVTIKQRKKVLSPKSRNALLGKFVESSTIRVSHIKSFEEGEQFVLDICWLLSFATQSRVAAYHFKFGKISKGYSVMGTFNSWRPPLGNGVGSLSDFLAQTWPNYQRLKTRRPLSSFIHLIGNSDLAGGLLEEKLSSSMICLESIKSYWAIDEGHTHGITEDPRGRFKNATGGDVHFEDLLKYTLAAVRMRVPRSFTRIIKLRNAMIHRGFIRETDAVTRFIFGAVAPKTLSRRMFAVMEQVHDLLREYMLRLLGYKGEYWAYSQRGMHKKTIR